MKKNLLLLFLLVLIPKVHAQDYFPNNETVQNRNQNFTAFTNATIYVTPNQIIKKGLGLNVDYKIIKPQKKDFYTKKSLPYSNISIKNTYIGTSTNILGKFTLEIPETFLPFELTANFIGYEDTSIIITKKRNQNCGSDTSPVIFFWIRE